MDGSVGGASGLDWVCFGLVGLGWVSWFLMVFAHFWFSPKGFAVRVFQGWF